MVFKDFMIIYLFISYLIIVLEEKLRLIFFIYYKICMCIFFRIFIIKKLSFD